MPNMCEVSPQVQLWHLGDEGGWGGGWDLAPEGSNGWDLAPKGSDVWDLAPRGSWGWDLAPKGSDGGANSQK